jgi:cell division protein WhiA
VTGGTVQLTLTRQVKQELARAGESLTCCGSWELKALLLRHGYYTIRQKTRILSTAVDDSAVARRLFNLLRQAGVTSPTIVRQQEKRLHINRYLVQVTGHEQVDALLVYLDLKEAGRYLGFPRRFTSVPKRNCCRKAFLRGVFMAGGSISISRRSGYHLEINCGSLEDAQLYQGMLGHFKLTPIIRRRNGSAFLYFKNAEAVADFLRIIEAGNTLLQLESMRVVSSMRNQVNRLVNCETANLEKVVASAQQQLDAIGQIDNLVGLGNISPALREAAMIRRDFPEASLKELGELLDPPVSKSAMNHRFRQLDKLLQKLNSTTKQAKIMPVSKLKSRT